MLARIYEDGPRQDRPEARALPALGLDDRSGERGERGRSALRRNGPVRLQPDPIEDALTETSEPAVERREVEWREPRRGPPQALGRPEVLPLRRLDDRERVRLSRDEIARQNPDAPAARLTARERDRQRRLQARPIRLAEEDRPALDDRPRESEAPLAAARARHEPQAVSHPAAASLTKVGNERTML
jgi:hypothetical protein